MGKNFKTLIISLVGILVLVTMVLGACTPAPAPTPTPTPTPQPTSTPTPTPTAKPTATPTPTPTVAWVPVWKDGKLQPLPDGFPNAPITLWNPHPPGHADEIYARALVGGINELSPVPFAVNSMGGSIPPWDTLSKLETLPRYQEGYQLSAATMGAYPTIYWTVSRGKWTIDDINTIISTDEGFNTITVAANAPWKTMQELIAYSKANPGKVRYAAAPGTAAHIKAVSLQKQIGVEWLLVPHGSASQGMLTLLGGGVEVVPYSTGSIIPYEEKGQVRVLLLQFNQAGNRPGAFPSAPTARDLNIPIPGGGGQSRGVFTHPSVPKTHIQWLFELFKAASMKQSYVDYVIRNKVDYIVKNPEQVKAGLKEETTYLGPVIKELGLAVEQK